MKSSWRLVNSWLLLQEHPKNRVEAAGALCFSEACVSVSQMAMPCVISSSFLPSPMKDHHYPTPASFIHFLQRRHGGHCMTHTSELRGKVATFEDSGKQPPLKLTRTTTGPERWGILGRHRLALSSGLYGVQEEITSNHQEADISSKTWDLEKAPNRKNLGNSRKYLTKQIDFSVDQPEEHRPAQDPGQRHRSQSLYFSTPRSGISGEKRGIDLP